MVESQTRVCEQLNREYAELRFDSCLLGWISWPFLFSYVIKLPLLWWKAWFSNKLNFIAWFQKYHIRSRFWVLRRIGHCMVGFMQCSRHLFNRGFCFSYLPACPTCLLLNDKRKNNYKIYTRGLEFNRIVWSRVENIVVGALLIVLWLLSQSLPMLTMFNTWNLNRVQVKKTNCLGKCLMGVGAVQGWEMQ